MLIIIDSLRVRIEITVCILCDFMFFSTCIPMFPKPDLVLKRAQIHLVKF